MSGTVGLLLAVAAAGAAPAAPVSDEVVVNQINELNVSALRKLEAGRFPAARKFLLDAERRGKERGGVAGVGLARTYLLLGALEMMTTGQVERANPYFRRAVCRWPEIRPTGAIAAWAGVARAFSAVQDAHHGASGCQLAAEIERRNRRRSDEDADLPVRIQSLDCPNEDEAVVGVDLFLRCAVAPNLPVAKVFLRYRPPASEEYAAVEMARTRKGWWTGAIPSKHVTGKSLMYYFEARNAAGKVIVLNGQPDSPNFALLLELCICD